MTPDMWTVLINEDLKMLELRNHKGVVVCSDTINRRGERALSDKAFESGAVAVKFAYDLARTLY